MTRAERTVTALALAAMALIVYGIRVLEDLERRRARKLEAIRAVEFGPV